MQVFIASSEDPAPIAQAIQKMVAAQTSANARVAEEEWKRVTSSRGLQAFSAEPAVSVRPTSSGIEISVRYITRASERHDLRTRLYQAVIEMLQGRPGAGAVVAAPVGDSGAAVSPVPTGPPVRGRRFLLRRSNSFLAGRKIDRTNLFLLSGVARFMLRRVRCFAWRR